MSRPELFLARSGADTAPKRAKNRTARFRTCGVPSVFGRSGGHTEPHRYDAAVSPRDERSETAYERADRNLSELLQELRVALPGVQVLFAFLLTVPFTERFGRLTTFQEGLYLVTLLSTAMTIALLVAPTANHRLLFRKRDKEHIVLVANRLAVAGIALMAVSTVAAILLITDMVFESAVPALTAAAASVVFGWLWFVMPMVRRARLDDKP